MVGEIVKRNQSAKFTTQREPRDAFEFLSLLSLASVTSLLMEEGLTLDQETFEHLVRYQLHCIYCT